MKCEFLLLLLSWLWLWAAGGVVASNSLSSSGIGSDSGLSNVRIRRASVDVDNAAGQHSIIDLPDCQDLRKYCTHQKTSDNLSMLECALSFSSSQLEALPEPCQHALWLQQRQLQLNSWVEHTLLPSYCAAEQGKLQSCLNSVDLWGCLEDQRQQMPQSSTCQQHLRRAHAALGPDYANIGDFYTVCGSLVEQQKCGRMNVEHLPALLSQLGTVQCLMANVNPATPMDTNCKMAINAIELQRGMLELFRVCAEDLTALCPQERPGTASGYKCLVRHKNDPSLRSHCATQIALRDQQMGRDYRVSHGLAKACKDDIKLHHCRRGVSEDKQVRLAQILLCLESVSKNGTKLAPECLVELSDHRRMLMTDYQLSPELLSDCADDIPKFCPEQHKAHLVNGFTGSGGEIIHCLLEHVRARRAQHRVTSQCQRGLETLIKVSDAGEDWRVDPVLRRACKPVVDVACKDVEGGEARVISCLMERIGTPVMRPECEQALLIIEYFVARDFKLDPQLYKHCRDDAIKYCRAKRQWDDVQDVQMDPERGPLILPCLHRMAYSEDEHQTLHKDCFREVKRVMRQRAISVDLMPEVEDYCLSDLSQFCGEHTEKGSEMECLQNKLEKLQPECKTVVTKYTEEEAANVELNPVIMAVCTEAMQQHCSDILKAGTDNGNMMDCLISHKNDADLRKDLRCRAAIEHFQIISLKNYHFTTKFKEACRPYVSRHCAASATKNEVVACLSEVMRNDTIKAQRHQIPKDCRQQVKSQLYQQRESIALDPKLGNACKIELEQFCADQKGPGQELECLVQNTPRLGKACHHAIFMIKKSELGDSGTDYTLLNTCKEMVYKFCPNEESVKLLDCLKKYKDDSSFDQRCHLVVVNRMIEQNTDFRFNPSLQSACGKNIDRYCSNIVATAQPNEELNGKVSFLYQIFSKYT
ncbi:hypothetical protein ACLKA7_014850 [Drosophila subpalustris]